MKQPASPHLEQRGPSREGNAALHEQHLTVAGAVTTEMNQPTARQAEAQHLLQVYGQLPIEPVSAHGIMLDCGDRQVIDFYGGHAVASLGYAHPVVVEALAAQAHTLFFQSNAVALDIRARAAATLAAFAPDGLDTVFFGNSGAEANENALRLACRLTGRNRVVAIEHGFHGRTAAAGAVTWGSEKWYAFPRRPFDVDFIVRDSVESARKLIGENTAAVILELVQGIAGAVDLDPEFVGGIAELCRRNGALLIVDEVQSGVGRCGQPFATDLYGIRPDILTTAKALGGGFPCSAMLVTDDIAASARPGDLGSTFGGGPLACRMIQTVIEVIEQDNLLENVRARSAQIRASCVTGPVESVQGRGLLLGLRCRRPAAAVRNELLEKNILVGTSADPHVIRMLPPLILEQHHVDKLAAALAALPED